MATNRPFPAEFADYAEEEIAQSAGSLGKDGVLEVSFRVGKSGRTRLSHDYVTIPFHMTGEISHNDPIDGLAALCIQAPTGGLSQGDRHQIRISVEEEANLYATTQSATKIHRMDNNYGKISIDLSVEKNGYLEYMPDPSILYRDSRCYQKVNLDLEQGATALFGEILIPGRLSRGEIFEFDRYYSELEARGTDGCVFRDNMQLDTDSHLENLGIFGSYSILSNLYLFTMDESVNTKELHDSVHGRISECEEVIGGVSKLPHDTGISVRILGNSSPEIKSAVDHIWAGIRQTLFDVGLPNMRKL